MKMIKIVGIFSILFLASTIAKADSFQAKERIWLSSYTNMELPTPVKLSSVPAIIHGLILGTTAEASDITFYDRKVISSGFMVSTPTAKTYINTAIEGDYYSWDIKFSSGIIYKKSGTAPITILWDYITRPIWIGDAK